MRRIVSSLSSRLTGPADSEELARAAERSRIAIDDSAHTVYIDRALRDRRRPSGRALAEKTSVFILRSLFFVLLARTGSGFSRTGSIGTTSLLSSAERETDYRLPIPRLPLPLFLLPPRAGDRGKERMSFVFRPTKTRTPPQTTSYSSLFVSLGLPPICYRARRAFLHRGASPDPRGYRELASFKIDENFIVIALLIF